MRRVLGFLLIALLATVTGGGLSAAGSNGRGGFEVWLVDQSDSAATAAGVGYGGRVYIYAGADLMGAAAASAQPTSVIDLGGATATMCLGSTGANPVRPHMVLFNSTYTRAVISFVASGHVVIFNAATRTPVACLRSLTGDAGAIQAHAAFPSPDDSYLLVANQNGERLHKFNTNFQTDTYSLAATLNLSALESSPGLPNNKPICPIIDSTSERAFITLAGGGLLVTDRNLNVVGRYDNATVHGNGCGGIESEGSMLMNSGAGAVATNPSEFDLYRFPLTGYLASNPINTPARQVIFSDDTNAPDRDSHGMVATRHGGFVWAADRARSVIEVFKAGTGAHLSTIDLVGGLSANPTPDLGDVSPSGNRVFFSTRGPNPLSGSVHAAVGDSPGLMVVQVEQGGAFGVIKAIVRISNIDATGVERADGHGLRVRLLG